MYFWKNQVSDLQLFDYADKKFCLSIEELEPLGDAIFCGAWKDAKRIERNSQSIVFERRFNAETVRDIGAAAVISEAEFTVSEIISIKQFIKFDIPRHMPGFLLKKRNRWNGLLLLNNCIKVLC